MSNDGILFFSLDQYTSRAMKYIWLDLETLQNLCAFGELKPKDTLYLIT